MNHTKQQDSPQEIRCSLGIKPEPHLCSASNDPRCAPSVTPQPHINPDQRLNVKELAALLNIGVSTAWKMVGDGRLPKPERWGSRCSRWRYGNLFPRKQS